jgi:hypothetical protein
LIPLMTAFKKLMPLPKLEKGVCMYEWINECMHVSLPPRLSACPTCLSFSLSLFPCLLACLSIPLHLSFFLSLRLHARARAHTHWLHTHTHTKVCTTTILFCGGWPRRLLI